MNSRPAAKKILAGALAAAYPFAVLWAVKCGGGFGAAAAVLMAAAVAGFVFSGRKTALLCGACVAGAAIFFRRAEFVKIYPVIMNLAAAAMFSLSLFKKPLVQIIGERMRGELPPRGVLYARKATIAWAVFMLILAACSAATLFASDEAWAVFNGFIAYVLIAAMFALEYIARKRFLKEDVC